MAYSPCLRASDITCEAGTFPDKCNYDSQLYRCTPCPDGTFSSSETMAGMRCEIRRSCSDHMLELPESIGSKIMNSNCVCKEGYEMHSGLFECFPIDLQTPTETVKSTSSPHSWNTTQILLPTMFGLFTIIATAIAVVIFICYRRKNRKLKQKYSQIRPTEVEIPLDDNTVRKVLTKADQSKEYNEKAMDISKEFLPRHLERGRLPALTRELISDTNAYDRIKERCGDDLREQIVQMIIEWENQGGHQHAKIRKLYEGLCKIGNKRLAEDLCSKIDKDMPAHNQISNGATPSNIPREGLTVTNGAKSCVNNGAPTTTD